MKLGNESPIGLATILSVLPGLIAVGVFIVLLALNGGDVDGATALVTAIIGGASFVFTGAQRQWRAGKGEVTPVTGEELHGGTPLPPGSEDEVA